MQCLHRRLPESKVTASVPARIGRAAAETVGKYAYYVKLRRSFSATENKLAGSFNEKRHTQGAVIGFLFYFHRTFTM